MENNTKHTQGEWKAINGEIIKQVTPINSIDNGFIKIAQCYMTIEGNSFEYKHLHPEIEKEFEDKPYLIERVITSNDANANAEFIVESCNNHNALIEALKNMVSYYDGDANLAYIDNAKQLLNSLNIK